MKIGKVYKVTDGSFWMIGRCLSIDKNDKQRGGAIFIASDKSTIYNPSLWCFGETSTTVSRTYQEATQDEIEWLETCIEAGKKVDKPPIPSISNNYSIF